MEKSKTPEISVKFRPDYQWPDADAQRLCPKCETPLQLQEDVPEYYGKPWWCASCQWQYSEEDLGKV